MSGTVTLNSVNLASATAATAFSGVTVGGTPSGSFTGTFGDVVSWSGFSWPGGSASPLWSFTAGGLTYTFNLANDYVSQQTSTFLNLLGNGTLDITGGSSSYTPTAASWSFTISNPTGGAHPNFNFTFANSQVSVPDGAATAMLLGIALSSLALLRKKLTA
ncbi:MAG: hypothetical protein ABSH48_04555 [Verrucomicrobiota bacterium]